jgi:outer membrane protein TolC
MLWIHKGIRHGRRLACAAVLVAMAASVSAGAAGLGLRDAEELALNADPGIQSVKANRTALEEMAVAARQLPDPMLKIGLMSLPTDSFRLDQEPMTQAQLGLVQKFPRGQSRSLRSEQISLRSEVLDESVRDQTLQILAVREQFLEVAKQQHLANINAAALVVFSDLVDITLDYYATGRVQQQDVLQASVELAKVQDRATRIAQAQEQARAKLATWIGAAAYEDIQTQWPQLRIPVPMDVMKDNLRRHPRILAAQKNVSVADAGAELARQNYKPEFSLDLTYGGRAGTNPDGSSRADMLSLMLVMDLPLFRNNRQDRVLAAQIAETSAAMFSLDDVYRRMRSEIEFNFAMFQRQKERVELFENTLLPAAASSSEATFEAFQSALEDMSTLLRARITEFDLQLEHAGLQAGVLVSQARLLYLEGEQK